LGGLDVSSDGSEDVLGAKIETIARALHEHGPTVGQENDG
jgi:hypothetical protein